MVLKDIEYYKPTKIEEATELFFALKRENKAPIYYSGGTEILTFRRLNMIQIGAIIDIKGIQECLAFEISQNYLIIGAAVPLTTIEDKNLFPLLSKTCSEIADRTARNKITIGGNICGQIFYREAVLPFLLADSDVIVGGWDGVKILPIHSIFDKNLLLDQGQFLIQIRTETSFVNLPFIVQKKRQQWETGYPLVTVASLKKDGLLRFAFSGVCPFPFRSKEMEREINNRNLSIEERVASAMHHLPSPILHDIEGSKDFRLFVLKNTLMDFLLEMEGV